EPRCAAQEPDLLRAGVQYVRTHAWPGDVPSDPVRREVHVLTKLQRTLERNESVRGSPARLGRALRTDFSAMVTGLQLPTVNEIRPRVRRPLPMGSTRKQFSTIIAGRVLDDGTCRACKRGGRENALWKALTVSQSQAREVRRITRCDGA